MIRQWGRPASKELTGNVISSFGVRKRIGEADNLGSEIQQPLFQIIFWPTALCFVRRLGDVVSSPFEIGRSALGVGRFSHLHNTTGAPSVRSITLSSMTCV